MKLLNYCLLLKLPTCICYFVSNDQLGLFVGDQNLLALPTSSESGRHACTLSMQ